MRVIRAIRPLLPGLGLSLAVTLAAEAVERLEVLVFGRAWIEALVLAIVLGALWRTVLPLHARYVGGVAFAGKILLEAAVVLLGASISAEAVASAGPLMILGIAAIVAMAIALSYAVGRLLGLGHVVSTLVACGNSICGNSAIAAVAPVVGADADDIASSIAFTAVLGVAVVLLMPELGHEMDLTHRQYGVFAGLTVYAVPQVIAATAPVAALSVQVGTLVKLVRVLMLGPVILGIAVLGRDVGRARPKLQHLVPWFIVGFLALMGLRSVGLIPQGWLGPIGLVTNALTVVSMSALGLSVDIRSVTNAGGRVITAASISLLLLGALAMGMIRLLGIA